MLWCLVLFILGVSLIVAEFFLPGAVCGIIGVILLVVSAGFGIGAYPEYTLFIIIGELAGAFGAIVLGLYLLSNTNLGRGLFLNKTLSAENAFGDNPSAKIPLGANGVALTALRPSGTIDVEGVRIDAVSDGDFLAEGSLVRVIEVNGNRVVVEAETDHAASMPADEEAPAADRKNANI